MPTPTTAILSSQLQHLQQTGFYAKLESQAALQGFPTTFFCAIASRETNCVNELGDFQGGEYHGVGIVQIDIQHDIARQARDDGSWKTNPDPLIAFGAELIAQNITAAQAAFSTETTDEQLKIVASGYNCGIGNAIKGANAGDSDLHTTGHDYGKDVMARKAVFDALIASASAASNPVASTTTEQALAPPE